LKNAADLRKHVLVHSSWFPADIEPPSWQRWFSVARRRWRTLPDLAEMQHLSFREELHAIEAVVAGQGIGLFSDVLVAAELASGALVKTLDLSLPGYRFYVVRRPGHSREKIIRAFSAWLKSVR
jgi:LysR family glycine cleavage system transcriptional activator